MSGMLIILFCLKVGAEPFELYRRADWEGLRGEAILRANDPENLDQRLGDLEKLRRMHHRCQLEMKSSLLPSGCLSLLELEKKMGFLPKASYENSRRALEEICRELLDATEKSDEWMAPPEKSPNACLNHWNHFVSLQSYAQGLPPSAEEFLNRFGPSFEKGSSGRGLNVPKKTEHLGKNRGRLARRSI